MLSQPRILAFGPGYNHLVVHHMKTTTVRAFGPSSHRWERGEEVTLVTNNPATRVQARIVDAEIKTVGEVTTMDLRGESPDCLTPEALRCVLGNIYRREMTLDTVVQIVRFEYIDRPMSGQRGMWE